jgi:hypothetical protein
LIANPQVLFARAQLAALHELDDDRVELGIRVSAELLERASSTDNADR